LNFLTHQLRALSRSLLAADSDPQKSKRLHGDQDDILIVMVMAADKREDSAVYQSVVARVTEKMAELPKWLKSA